VFDVDFVIDASSRFRSMQELNPHLENGAKRVILSVLPEGDVDQVVLFGVNEASASAHDRIISAGSASTTATALALKIIMDCFAIEHATMTSVHAYTSDQALQDYAGADHRRSRSGAENIIPNNTPALHWVQQVLPEVSGKFTAYALNVPVQVGSMLDITVALTEALPDVDRIKDLFIAAEENVPALVGTTNDLIVSSDIKGCTKSLLVDLQGTIKAGSKMVKILAWHESLGHASRILDIAETYADLDATERKETSS
jgi:glyceraldehyde 3-phosphate dehydrogenase